MHHIVQFDETGFPGMLSSLLVGNEVKFSRRFEGTVHSLALKTRIERKLRNSNTVGLLVKSFRGLEEMQGGDSEMGFCTHSGLV
jgi:hypothetical protein